MYNQSLEVRKETLTSLEVAKMVEKQHNELMKVIRRLIEHLDVGEISHTDYFTETTYEDTYKRLKPMYLLTKMGCELIANKMTGAKGTIFSAKYVKVFNDMQQHLIPQTKAEALKLAYEQALQIEQLEEQAKQDKPLIEFANNVKKAVNNITVKEFANILCDDKFHIGQKRLFEWLRLYKYIDKTNKPYQQYLERDYFRLDYREYKRNNSVLTYSVTLITPKGQIYFANKLKEVE